MKYRVELVILGLMTSGCIATPRFEVTERIEFNYTPMSLAIPVSHEERLCCVDCRA